MLNTFIIIYLDNIFLKTKRGPNQSQSKFFKYYKKIQFFANLKDIR